MSLLINKKVLKISFFVGLLFIVLFVVYYFFVKPKDEADSVFPQVTVDSTQAETAFDNFTDFHSDVLKFYSNDKEKYFGVVALGNYRPNLMYDMSTSVIDFYSYKYDSMNVFYESNIKVDFGTWDVVAINNELTKGSKEKIISSQEMLSGFLSSTESNWKFYVLFIPTESKLSSEDINNICKYSKYHPSVDKYVQFLCKNGRGVSLEKADVASFEKGEIVLNTKNSILVEINY